MKVVKKYTKLEMELYNNLIELSDIFKKLDSNIVDFVLGRGKKGRKTDELMKLIDIVSDLDKARILLIKTKIPKKLLILNKLEEKKNEG